MRDILDRLKTHNRLTLFCGMPTEEFEFPQKGLLLGTFDQAMAMGRYVWECQVDLDLPGEDESIGDMVHVCDPFRVEPQEVHDTHCPIPLDEDAIRQQLVEFVPDAGAHVLMVTGKLAHAGLKRIMEALNPTEFTYEIVVLDKAVAAWFDTQYVAEQLGDRLRTADVVLLPGKTAGDVDALSRQYGTRIVRGTNCYSELPTFFEMSGIEVAPDGIVKPKIIMLGRPGSGKTTYAAEIASTYEIPHVSIGDIIRAGAEEGDETAIAATEYLGRGELVPHNVMAELVRSRILMPDMRNGFVLDGYPRIERDVQWLTDMGVRADAIVYLDCPEEEAERRLLASGRSDMVLVGKAAGQFEIDTLPMIDHYRRLPSFIEIDTQDPNVLSVLYTELEAMFQKCLMPDGRDVA